LIPCPHCGDVMVSHRVCPACGHYNGKEVIKIAEEQQA
jgi:large subunit ribosomal protein L32